MPRDLTRQVVTVVAFVATLAVNGAAVALPLNGVTTGEISDRFDVFVIPANYVFSIWSLIYLGLAAFTVLQALPSRRDDPTLRALGYLPALTGLLNASWLVLWQYQVFAATVPVMLALLLTLIAIRVRLADRRRSLDTAITWAVRVPFSIYLGWITVATIANIAQTSAALGFDGFGLPPEVVAAAVLLVGLAIATAVVLRLGDIAYGLVIVWAYVGIVVKEQDTALVAAVAALGAVVVAGLVVLALAGRVGPGHGLARGGAPA